ncbi:MAG: hypothetical protein AAFP20_08505 [Cyanobacteria bacterium J06614_10]
MGLDGLAHMLNAEGKNKIDSSMFPSFICIGGQRCGSTWLDRALRSHPQVSLSPKESSFFNLKIRTEGIEWYEELFQQQPESSGCIKGDITPSYSAVFCDEVGTAKLLT